jgi:hypothetical protein
LWQRRNSVGVTALLNGRQQRNSAATTSLLSGSQELVSAELNRALPSCSQKLVSTELEREAQQKIMPAIQPSSNRESNKENEEYEQFLAWKHGVVTKGSSIDPKDLLCHGHVFQNLSNCNIVMVSGQGNDSSVSKILDSIGGN